MYKVLCDDTLMCDSRIEELALINPVVKLEENKAGSFSFTIPPEHPMYDAVAKRKSLVQVFRDDEMVFSGICIEEKKDFYKRKTIYCEGELTFFNDSVQRPARYQGVSVRGLLETYIAAHNAQVEEAKQFTVGQVTVTDPNDYISCYTNMESTMQALKEDLVDDLGGFFRIRHVDGVRYLDYLAESPNTNSQVIKLGKNLMDFTTNIDSSDIATAIIPLGAKLEESTVEGLEVRLTIESVNDGLDYVHSADAVDAYGWIYKTVEWNDVTTAEALKRKGEQYLSDIQFENMVIQAKAVDLHLTDKEIEQFKISDQIHVVSAPHGLNRYFRLTKQTMNLNNPEKDTITLGKDERLTLSAKSNQASEEIKKAIESIVPASTILNQAIANATQLITQSMNGYITTVMNEDGSPKELLIMDTPDIKTATKVWRWNINGLGYSSTGYNGKYALAMTMDGKFVADGITVEGLEVGKNVKMGADAVISWGQVTGTENVATTGQIPTNNNQLDNGAGYTTMQEVEGKGYQTAPQVTQITKDTVTTAYVNALKIKADSVDAENITGVTIKGKKLLGGSIDIGDGNFTVAEDGTVKAVGEFSTTKDVNEDYVSRTKMTGSGLGLFKRTETETEDAEVECVRLAGIEGEKGGMLDLSKNGKREVGLGAGAGRGLWVFEPTNETAVAKVSRNSSFDSGEIVLRCAVNATEFFYVGVYGANYLMKFGGWQFKNSDSLTVNGKAILQNTNGVRIGHFDQLAIGGGAAQNVEWVWDSTLQRWVLCTVT